MRSGSSDGGACPERQARRAAIDATRGPSYRGAMCRSIKTLRRTDPSVPPATPDEVQAAALQFVRKVSGYRVPSQRNAAAFEAAVADVAAASSRLLDRLAGS